MGVPDQHVLYIRLDHGHGLQGFDEPLGGRFDRALQGVEQVLQALPEPPLLVELALDVVEMAADGLEQADPFVVKHTCDLVQAQSQPTQREHAVQPLDIVLAVEAVAARAALDRHDQLDLVVMVKCSHGETGSPRELADLPPPRALNAHTRTLRPHVT